VPDEAIVEKVHFSCVAEGCLFDLPAYAREQMIVAGTEAHVCVLQTCMGLLTEGKQVYVVADAVGSRDPENADLALERLRQNGAQIVSREMVAFEWLQRAGTDVFRRVSRAYIR
jgi:nicotinamidase-related amidase